MLTPETQPRHSRARGFHCPCFHSISAAESSFSSTSGNSSTILGIQRKVPDEHVLLRSCCDRVGRRLRWVVSCPEEIAAGLFAGEPGNLCLRKTAWWGREKCQDLTAPTTY
jgi:hypothetical protein